MDPIFEQNKYQKVTAVFVVPPLVHLQDMGGPAHIFYEAKDYGAPLNLKYISTNCDQKEHESSCGLFISRLADFNELALKKNDIIFIPGLERELLFDNTYLKSIQPFLKWLRNQHEKGVTICSVCTGAFLLAESGLLVNRECTTHWKYFKIFEEKYKNINLLRNRLFVESEGIYSSAGVVSGIDLALYILEQWYGTHFSASIAKEVVIYFRRGKKDPQLSIFLKYKNHQEDRIHKVQEWISKNIKEKNSIEELADLVSTSPRNLTRLFKDTTGITIGQYLEKLRLEYALQLLGKKNKIEIIAQECGFQSTNQLRNLFKKYIDVLPSNYKIMS